MALRFARHLNAYPICFYSQFTCTIVLDVSQQPSAGRFVILAKAGIQWDATLGRRTGKRTRMANP